MNDTNVEVSYFVSLLASVDTPLQLLCTGQFRSSWKINDEELVYVPFRFVGKGIGKHVDILLLYTMSLLRLRLILHILIEKGIKIIHF